MAKRSYVWINGELVEKTGDNECVIAGEKWTCIAGHWAKQGEHGPAFSFMVMPDIKPYQSMVDGSMITSRSQHRDHLRQHNCIEVGNEKIPEPKREFTATRGLREELIARIYK